MSPVTISAVIPAYNREATIARAIRSALEQTRPPDEIVVVDDGSRDDTRRIVETFGDRVRCLHQENAGAGEARNKGVAAASHPWIAFLDSDDYWLPDHLARTETAIEATSGRASLYFSDFRQTPEEGGRLLWEVAGFRIEGHHELSDDPAEWAMLPCQPMMLQTSVFRRDRYLALGGLSRELRCRHDTHLFFKVCFRDPVCAVAGCGAEQTSDDASGGRVTAAGGGFLSEDFTRETLLMYRDCEREGRQQPLRVRRELRRRRGAAHLRIARIALDEGRWLEAGRQLGPGLWRAPGRIARRLFPG